MNRIPDDAFEAYVSMGAERSYRAVAERYGVSKRAVTKHASKHGWNQRLQGIESQVQERTDKKLVETIEETRMRHLRTIRAMNARALEAIKQYPLTNGMEAMRAAEMAIKLERLIIGEPNERSEAIVEQTTKREMQRWLEPSEN